MEAERKSCLIYLTLRFFILNKRIHKYSFSYTYYGFSGIKQYSPLKLHKQLENAVRGSFQIESSSFRNICQVFFAGKEGLTLDLFLQITPI